MGSIVSTSRWLATVLALAVLFVVGGVSGATASGLFSPEAASAPPAVLACEADECEAKTRCVDNPGEHTQCSFDGSQCKTKACAGAPPSDPEKT